jgi:hypothetical protein
MYPKLLFFLVPAVLLFAAALAIFFWDRAPAAEQKGEPGNGVSEGAFRAFYHALWVLVLWSGLSFSLPLWISYKEKIVNLEPALRWPVVAKALAFPTIMLVMLWYGGRQGYLKWIDSLSWPDKENE